MKNILSLFLLALLSFGLFACQNEDVGVGSAGAKFSPPADPVWKLDTIAVAEQVRVNGIWGVDSDEVYAVGTIQDSGGFSGVVWRYDGTSWQQFYSKPNVDFQDIHGISRQSLWVTGILDPSNYPGGALVLHWNGSNWEESLADPSIPGLLAVWAGDDQNVYAVGKAGTIMRFNGQTWTQEENPLHELYPAVGIAAIKDVWGIVVGRGNYRIYAATSINLLQGVILRRTNCGWGVEFYGPERIWQGEFRSVWASGVNNIYAIEYSGVGGAILASSLYHRLGSELGKVDLIPSYILYSVRGSGKDVFVVGMEIYRLEGNAWILYDSYPEFHHFSFQHVWVHGTRMFATAISYEAGLVLQADFGGSGTGEH